MGANEEGFADAVLSARLVLDRVRASPPLDLGFRDPEGG